MPIYEYQCKACCHCFEELVLSASAPAPPCPKCECADVQKLMSASCVLTQGIADGSAGHNAAGCKPTG